VDKTFKRHFSFSEWQPHQRCSISRIALPRQEAALYPAAANPAGRSGAWHTEVTEQHGVTFFARDVAKPVVIRLTAARGRHASRMLSRTRWSCRVRASARPDLAASSSLFVVQAYACWA
jgi:hypothetical protein